MSWSLNGRTYHDWGEYQRARAAQESRDASSRARALSGEVNRLQSRLQDSQRQYNSLSGDIAAQARVSEQIRRDVQGLERAQANLESAQREYQAQANRRMDNLQNEIELTQEDIAELERVQQQHMREVEREFDNVRTDLRNGLAEAEERRRETEERLQAEIQQVDDKVEADRQARLEKEQSELARAALQIQMAEEQLTQHDASFAKLGLDEEAGALSESVKQARQLHTQGDSAAALAAGHAAFSEGRTLNRRVLRRAAELDASRSNMLTRVQAIQERIAIDDLQKLFKVESNRVAGILQRVEDQVGRSYGHYPRLHIEAVRDEELLERCEQQVDVMESSVESVRELMKQRTQRAQSVVKRLADVYGPLSEAKQRFADPNDKKSPLVLECAFGGARVDVHLALDGGVDVDGYGHDSNATCKRRAQAVYQALSEENAVSQPEVDADNRMQPSVHQSESQGAAWASVNDSLEKLESKV